MRRFWSGGQYSLFRILFGCYLVIHFTYLLPWSAEIFSNHGALQDAASSPFFGLIPNILSINDSPEAVYRLLISAALASILFSIGLQDKLMSIWILYVLICIFARNPLIANPAQPYIGWMLLAHLFIPSGPCLSFSNHKEGTLGDNWHLPCWVYKAALVILALSYSYSGYTKLLSPSWISGDAISFVLHNPLARDYWLRDWMSLMPESIMQFLTWFILYIELLYAPLALIKKMRKWLWLSMLIVQFGFLVLLSFPDLTIPMILFHMFTFDPRWVKFRRATTLEYVYFDGHCGFCHAFVKLILAEDIGNKFRFSPLQGQHFTSMKNKFGQPSLTLDTMIVLTDKKEYLYKSDAAIHCLKRLGGLWSIIARMMILIPKSVRDLGYSSIGKIRRKILRTPKSICPVATTNQMNKFIP